MVKARDCLEHKAADSDLVTAIKDTKLRDRVQRVVENIQVQQQSFTTLTNLVTHSDGLKLLVSLGVDLREVEKRKGAADIVGHASLQTIQGKTHNAQPFICLYGSAISLQYKAETADNLIEF